MPSITDAVQAASGLTGYTPVEPQSDRNLPSVDTNYGPMRNSMIRCPIPTLWNDSSDSQRQFYINGQVPQVRIMAPPQGSTTGGSSGGNASVVEGGSSGGSGGGSTPTTPTVNAVQTSLTTSLLTPGAVYMGTIKTSSSMQLLSLSVGSPCRIQMYGSNLAQLQDLSRGLDQAPPAGVAQNIITDLALDQAPFQWFFQNRMAANADNPQKDVLYVTITNLDAISDVVTLTMQYVPLETT